MVAARREDAATSARPGANGSTTVKASLLFYRVLAYTVGVGLVILVLIAVPLKYFADSPTLVAIVGPLHGFLYMVYLVAAVNLAFRSRWSPVKTVLVMLAGTIPFVSFVAERKVTADEEARATVS
jgi:integral membrane protein